jgi:hypothetical protein
MVLQQRGRRKTGWCGRAEKSGRGRGEIVGFVERGPSDGGGVATNCYDERNKRRQEKKKKRRELSILRAGELATYIVRSYPAESSKSVSHATRVA